MKSRRIEVDGRALEVRNLHKVFFPEDGLTKGDLVDYYLAVGEVMVRHTRRRPLVMQRFPDGIAGEGWYQKQVGEYFPPWIPRVTVPKTGGTITHAVVDDVATLIYLADQAVVVFHVWLSQVDHLREPDLMVFDLDPPEGAAMLSDLRDGARLLRTILEDELGLWTAIKTTGSRGYHVVAPIRPELGFDDVRACARAVAETLVARDPDRFTVEQRKDARGGRIFVDYLRNSWAQTWVAPYSVRARRGAPVSAPIGWDDLDDVAPWGLTVTGLPDRLRRVGDPWADLYRHRRSLRPAARRLGVVPSDGGEERG